MILTNGVILNFVQNFDKNFTGEKQYLPAKVNFYLYKNIEPLMSAAETIIKTREDIFQKFGEYNEQNQTYSFSRENKELANKELSTLALLTQDVPITKISLSDLEGLSFTPEQMKTIFFMIEEN